MNVWFVVDNPNSWMVPYAKMYAEFFRIKGYDVDFTYDHNSVGSDDIGFFLSCEKKISSEILNRAKHCIIVHESALPEGKGWSPVTWQVLEGKNKIPITLFEAVEKIDSGPIYLQDYIYLDGTELIDEIRLKQAAKTFYLIEKFLKESPSPIPQKGNESFYRRRTPKDSELDPNLSLVEQFNLLRVVDNERYPAFFYYKGNKYVIKIYKEDGGLHV